MTGESIMEPALSRGNNMSNIDQQNFIQNESNSGMSLATNNNNTEDNTLGVENNSSQVINTNGINHERLTTRRKVREEMRGRIQWSKRMKTILQMLVEKVGKGYGYMAKLHTSWIEALPIYQNFTKQNLRDYASRMKNIDTSNQCLETLVKEEMMEYTQHQMTKTGEFEDVENLNEIPNRSDMRDEEHQEILEFFNSSADESFYGFEEETTVEIDSNHNLGESERCILSGLEYWKNKDINTRIKLSRKPKPADVTKWNNILGNVIKIKSEWSMWELNCLVYATMVQLHNRTDAQCYRKFNDKYKLKMKNEIKEDLREVEISSIRKYLSWIDEVIKSRKNNQKLSTKMQHNLMKLRRNTKSVRLKS